MHEAELDDRFRHFIAKILGVCELQQYIEVLYFYAYEKSTLDSETHRKFLQETVNKTEKYIASAIF